MCKMPPTRPPWPARARSTAAPANNYDNATPNALAAGRANSVLSQGVQTSNIQLQIGRYTYVNANQRFEGQFPGPSNSNWSMVQATDFGERRQPARVFARVQFRRLERAGHRHGSPPAARHLHHSRLLGFDAVRQLAGRALLGQSHVEQPRYRLPGVRTLFEHFGGGTAGDDVHESLRRGEHHHHDQRGRPPIVNDFYTNSSGSPAFTAAASSYSSTPGGDNYLKINKNTGSTYCTTPADLLKSAR